MRFRPQPIGVLLSSLALAATLLGGCGSSSSGNGIASKTPTQIIAAAKAATAGAVSAHVAGSIVSEGKPIALDMELLANKGGKGRITVEGLTVNLIEVDKAVYINGSTAFYKHLAGSAAATLLQGKWLKAPASSQNFASFSALTDLGKLVDSTLAAHGSLARAKDSTVGAQKVVGLTDAAKGGTLYVASTGAPYPVELVKTGTDGGKIVFDRWNKPVTLAPPANSVNINQLQSGH